MKPHISVVEDDPDISRLVRHHLEGAGFAVKLYPTGNAVLTEAERQRPALFILDIMVPGKDGLELCRQIRQTQALAMIPVIFLTAKSSEADRVLGLELGADDYIPKPFSPRELVARVKAVLRRFERPLAPGPVRVGSIEIDPAAMTLVVEGNPVTTTADESAGSKLILSSDSAGEEEGDQKDESGAIEALARELKGQRWDADKSVWK